MESLWRTVGGLFAPSGYRRALILATFEDTCGIREQDMEDVLQGLIGGDSTISQSEARELLLQRLRDSWTWAVVLKVLIILHGLVTSCLSTTGWLEAFFNETNVLELIQSFREGEGTDVQAETHSSIIRRYASYIATLVSDMKKHNTPAFLYIKRGGRGEGCRKPVSCAFRTLEDEDVFGAVADIAALLDKCLAPYLGQGKIVSISGRCKLTTCAADFLGHDALALYRALSVALGEVQERYSKLHPADMPTVEELCKHCRTAKDNLQCFLFFLKKPSSLASLPLPPLPTTKLDSVEGTRSCEEETESLDTAEDVSLAHEVEQQGTFAEAPSDLALVADKPLRLSGAVANTDLLSGWEDCMVPSSDSATEKECQPGQANTELCPKELHGDKFLLRSQNNARCQDVEIEDSTNHSYAAVPEGLACISSIPLPAYPHPTHVAMEPSCYTLPLMEQQSLIHLTTQGHISSCEREIGETRFLNIKESAVEKEHFLEQTEQMCEKENVSLIPLCKHSSEDLLDLI